MKSSAINLDTKKMAALAVGCGVLFIFVIWAAVTFRTGVTDPHVRIETVNDMRSAGAGARRQFYVNTQLAMAGEVATTEARVREAAAVATAASLMLAVELANRRAPANAPQLVAALAAEGLLPPGFSAGQQPGTLITNNGMLSVRFRGAPVGIEVISIGKSRESGPAILIRTPEDERHNQSGIWLAESLSEVRIPQPFAAPAELIAVGWQPDSLPAER